MSARSATSRRSLNVLALPFLFRSIDHLYKVIDGPIGDDILGSLEPDGFIGLTFYDSGARSIYTAHQAGADARRSAAACACACSNPS